MREATAKSTSFIDAYIAACDIMQNGVPQWTDDTTPRTDKPVRFVWAGKFVHHGALGYVTSCELA